MLTHGQEEMVLIAAFGLMWFGALLKPYRTAQALMRGTCTGSCSSRMACVPATRD